MRPRVGLAPLRRLVAAPAPPPPWAWPAPAPAGLAGRGPASSSRAAAAQLVGGSRGFCDDQAARWKVKHPHRFFDFKAFRKALKEKKESLSEAELREVRREYAPPPPKDWTVLTFLEQMKFGDGAEVKPRAPGARRRRGSPSSRPRCQERRRPPTRETGCREPVREVGGLHLHDAAGHHAHRRHHHRSAEAAEPIHHPVRPRAVAARVARGDPWIYISWELQRREQDVRERYVELVVKPRERASQSELAITKSSRPLHMNRKFRMIPADLYIVPSAENFPLAPDKFEMPKAFQKYRQPDIF